MYLCGAKGNSFHTIGFNKFSAAKLQKYFDVDKF